MSRNVNKTAKNNEQRCPQAPDGPSDCTVVGSSTSAVVVGGASLVGSSVLVLFSEPACSSVCGGLLEALTEHGPEIARNVVYLGLGGMCSIRLELE